MAENFQNFFVTKLREACDATATTIYVDTVPAITEGTLVLEYANSTKHEIIHFTGVSGYGLTGCTRGLEGTTAQSHSAGTDVRQNLTAGMIDKIINGVITTENIANSAVTTAKINDGAVTADKIDFTTFASQRLTFTSKDTTQSGTTIASYTVPEDGLYLLTAGICFQRNGGGSTELLIWAKQGSTSLGNVGAYVSDEGRRTPVSGTWAIKATKGDNLTVGATSVYGNIWTNSGFSEIYVVRIA